MAKRARLPDSTPPHRSADEAVRGAKRSSADSPPPRPRRRGGLFVESVKIALLGGLLAYLATAAGLLLAGHAPSWRSVHVLNLHGLAFPVGLFFGWMALRALARRYSGAPLALWIGLAILLTAGLMLLAPGLGFAIVGRSILEEPDDEATWNERLWMTAASFYLYVSTGFRAWHPFGFALPLVVAFLFWRKARRDLP